MKRHSRIVRQALRILLPVSGAVTLVVLPLALLYDQSRQETLQSRLSTLGAGSLLQVQQVLEEVKADSNLAVSLARRVRRDEHWRQLSVLFKAQLQEYPRYSAIAVFARNGQPLLQVGASGTAATRSALQEGVRQGRRLAPGQLWLSPLFWSAGQPTLLAVRPLMAGDQRAGTLVYVASLGQVARDFDKTINNPATQHQGKLRGYLLSPSGEVLNAAAGGPAVNFASRYPGPWQQLRQQPDGLVSGPDGTFLDITSPQSQGLQVVLQLPPEHHVSNTIFNQPQSLVPLGLILVLMGAASTAIAIAQERVEGLRQQERQATTQLQAILSNAGVGMGLCDPDAGTFRTVNDALCQLLGRQQADLLGRPWFDHCHPDDRGSAETLMRQLLESGEAPHGCRLRFRRPDGQRVWGDLALARTDDTVIVQVADVSELVAQAAYLEAAAEAGIVGVWDWDIPRNVLTWDAVMFKLYGLKREDFSGAYEAWSSAVHPDDRAFAEEEIHAAVQGWRPYQPHFRVIWPDGSVRHLQARSRTTFGADGRALRMIGVNYDITDQVMREQEIDQQRGLLAATLNALVDPQVLITRPPELRLAQVNPAAASFFGRSANQLIGRHLTELLSAADNAKLLRQLGDVAEQGAPLIADEVPLQLPWLDEPLHVDLRVAVVRDGLAISFRDVSKRRHAIQELAASEERFRLLALNVTDVVFLCEDEWLEWIAPGITTALGWRPDDWLGQPLDQFCHPDNLATLQAQLARVKQGRQVIFRARLSDQEQNWRWVEIHAGPFRNAEGKQKGLVGALRVVDAEVAAEAELDRRARTDPLTGLLNRQEILERLEQIQTSRRLTDGNVALLFCDIDHFKAINDQHGHGGGDAVLQMLAKRLQQAVRAEDLVGRFGGDELLIALRSVPSLAAAETIAGKIHQAAHGPISFTSGVVHPTLSIGVTLIQPDEPLSTVILQADKAMYEAKQHGRDRVIAFYQSPEQPECLPEP